MTLFYTLSCLKKSKNSPQKRELDRPEPAFLKLVVLNCHNAYPEVRSLANRPASRDQQ